MEWLQNVDHVDVAMYVVGCTALSAFLYAFMSFLLTNGPFERHTKN
jgi:hypothetical protein